MFRVQMSKMGAAGKAYDWAQRQPPWALKLALGIGALVFLVPVLALVVLLGAAVLTALLALLVLSFLWALVAIPLRVLLGLFQPGKNDGRQNVIVVRRE